MSVDAIVENLTQVLSSGPGLDGSLKMNFGDDGVVRIEGTSVSTEDSEADATINIDLEQTHARPRSKALGRRRSRALQLRRPLAPLQPLALAPVGAPERPELDY